MRVDMEQNWRMEEHNLVDGRVPSPGLRGEERVAVLRPKKLQSFLPACPSHVEKWSGRKAL